MILATTIGGGDKGYVIMRWVMNKFQVRGQDWKILEHEVTEYQSQKVSAVNDSKILERIWLGVSEYVRSYPRLAFRQVDEDISSDFYLYIWERRETLFDKFDSDQGSFRNYLSLRLRSHYLNFFLRERKKWSRDQLLYSDKEELFHKDWDYSAGKDFQREDRESTYDLPQEKSSLFSQYEKDPFNYLVLKLYYFDFFTEDDFVRLKEFTGKQYTELLEDFDLIRDEVTAKKRRRLRMDERLGSIYLDLLTYQKQSDKEDGDKGKKILESREKVLKEYNRINEFPSFKAIAKILGATETKIANTIVYQRKLLEKKLYGID